MRIVAISDTHTQHDKVKVPECDLLIHSGDISHKGELHNVYAFLFWFNQQPAKYKVFIAGNHDFSFQDGMRMNKIRQALIQYPDIIYLEDSSVTIEGIKLWGSPWTPRFYDWAFNADRGAAIKRAWDMIPEDTDILIVHGPPKGYGDRIAGSTERVGCEDLLQRLLEVKPKICIFGHIHEGYGMYTLRVPSLGSFGFHTDVTLINASVLDEQYFIANDPIAFEYEDFV